MNRLARRIQLGHRADAPHYSAAQQLAEQAHRERSARAVRTALRRQEPVALVTPRWSCPQAFLEDVSLELAVSEPGMGCRTVNLRPLQGRHPVACWQFLLRILAQLSATQGGVTALPTVAERRGFRQVVEDLLERADERNRADVALLAHGAEHLPVEVAEDLLEAWEAYGARHPAHRRCVLLLGGTVNAPALREFEGRLVELADFGPVETAEVLGRMVGPRLAGQVSTVAGFTGGMPALVEAVGRSARHDRHLARDEEALLGTVGALGDEIRGAVDIIASDHRLAARLDLLLPGEPLPTEPDLDQGLLTAGLARRIPHHGGDLVCIRAPAIGALVG
jgi:hypothetical protein